MEKQLSYSGVLLYTLHITGKKWKVGTGRMLKNMYRLINQDSRFDNEPKRLFVLLRWIYLLMFLYYLGLILLMYFLKPHRFFWLGAGSLLVVLLAFGLTYRFRTKVNLLIYALIQLAWINTFVYQYGWDCGVQHFIFALLVLLYFSVYDALTFKILCTAGMFAFRFGLFLYCRMYEPMVELPVSFEVMLQVYNSVSLFIIFGIICGNFSSNIETAEKKLIQYNKQLQWLASVDPLTGVWNRRTMSDHLESYMVQSRNRTFVVVLGDIDHFKQINDQWGHNCGDAVLVWLTGIFQEEIGERGSICRWGGEEFLFFPKMNGDEVFQVISELKVRLDSSRFEWEGESMKVSMTFGLEEYDFQPDIKELVKRADEKMYLGKERGRNRVIY